VKTTLFAATLVVTLTLSAVAAQKKPPVAHHLAGSDQQTKQWSGIPVPPALCNPCLFYGGDINTSDFNAAGLSDENTLLIPNSSTYGNFNVTTGTVTINGILINVQADANFDPLVASYDVRTGVTEGSGGTQIASGTVGTTVAATGRNFLGLNEYTVAVSLTTPLVLGPGGYWFNLTPSCTNGGTDGSCSVGRFFVSNTTNKANNVNGGLETQHQMFLNSPFFGLVWANWCDSFIGLNQAQCNSLSFGLIGTHSND
jgi:hypothetical protein